MAVEIDVAATFFGDEPPEAKQFYEMYGRILALWGRIEMPINNIAHRIYRVLDDTRQMPGSLYQKTVLLERTFKEVTEFSPMSEKYQATLVRIRDLAPKRNRLCHDLPWTFREDDGVVKLAFVNTQTNPAEWNYWSLQEFERFAEELGWLALNTMGMTIEFDRLVKKLETKAPTAAQS